MSEKNFNEPYLKREREKLEYQQNKDESTRDLEERWKEIEKLEKEVRKSKQELELEEKKREIEKLEKQVEKSKLELALNEGFPKDRNLQDILRESGFKEMAIQKRLHMSGPTFTVRKKEGGASLWRLDEIKTLALMLGKNPLELVSALLPAVDIIPEDKEEARLLRRGYSKDIENKGNKKKRGRGRPPKHEK